jgi:hypothetical protein
VAFGVFAPLWLAVIGAIEFGVMAAVCYVQTVRALQRRTP